MNDASTKASKLVKNGSSVKLCGLNAAEMNGQTGVLVGSLMEGRFPLRITGHDQSANPLMVKPANCSVVCSGCLKDAPAEGPELKACSRCRAACYCSGACQKQHWAAHKATCKKLAAELTEVAAVEASGFQDHPSWKKHLSPQHRALLRTHHARAKCPVAWPVTGLETENMLTSASPCFLAAHPNQRFKISLAELPSFQMRYPEGGGISGKVFPPGRRLPLLQEEWRRWEPPKGRVGDLLNHAWHAENRERYRALVPPHFPVSTTLAVVGEVVWSRRCELSMLEFYGRPSNAGTLFRWPAGEVVGVCPGTGERVVPDGKTVHLLVAHQMQGSVARGSTLEMLTRIMPRILTLKGYAALLGPEDEPNYPFYQGHVMRTTAKVDAKTGQPTGPGETLRRPFYPEVLRELANNGGGGKKKSKKQPPPPSANDAWEVFHEEGSYLAFERLLEDKMREVEALDQGGCEGLRMKVGGPIQGKPGGPSVYEGK